MAEIQSLMGITDSYEHLFPEIRTSDDLAKIFGTYDQLEMTDKDRRKEQAREKANVSGEIKDIVANPDESIKGFVKVL